MTIVASDAGSRTKRGKKRAAASNRVAPSRSALAWPAAFVLGLAAFCALPRINGIRPLVESFAVASVALAGWLLVLWWTAGGRRLTLTVSLRPQHYLQALAHSSILIYWGLYWPPLKDAAALIVAQIVFAYAFDMLLAWSRRDDYALGFGPFPIILSTNLFLRFHDDWFALQFLMIGVGFLAKELIRWDRDGRRVHIFNPSSFTLAVFSLGLILTGTTRIAWGQEIATLLILPPQIYLFIFLVSLPAQFLFRITTMTLPAVLTTYLFSVVYLKVTGTYFFIDSNVPIAVFLGMNLLFTDPSTSPRTELGRIFFGVLYGATVIGLYAFLGWCGVPRFYDKLLQVPVMNLMVRAIDRAAESTSMAWLTPSRLVPAFGVRARGVAYATVWVLVFGAIAAAKGMGDYHPGHTETFWQKACADQRSGACATLASIERRDCDAGSLWACNEVAKGPRRDPTIRDYTIVLRNGKGPIPEQQPAAILERACREGWMAGCGDLAALYLRGGAVPVDKPRAAALWEQACAGGHATSCSNVGFMLRQGDGIPADRTRAIAYLKRACDLGFARACEWLRTEAQGMN